MSYADHLSIFVEVSEHTKEIRDKIATQLDTALVVETPIDTGQAHRNWIMTDGRTTEEQILGPGSASATIQRNKAVIRAAKAFTILYDQNNIEYIVPLNDGTSSQAPRKYVDRIVERVANGN